MNPWEMNLIGEDETPQPSTQINTTGNPWELGLVGADEKIKPTGTKLTNISSMSLQGALAGTEQKSNPFESTVTEPVTVPEPTAESKPTLDLISPRVQVGSATTEERTQASVQDIVSDAQVVTNRIADLGRLVASPFSEEQEAQYNTSMKNIQDTNIKELQARGIPAEYKNNILYVYDDQGNQIEVEDPGILKSLYKEKFGIGGAIAGGILGAKAGSMMPGGIAGKLIGGAAGAAVGASAGSGVDSLLANINLVNKASGADIVSKMVDSGVAEIVLAPVGYVAGKLTAEAARGVKRVYDHVFDGNLEGAYKELLSQTGHDAESAKLVVDKLEALIGPLRGMNDKEKAIYALRNERGGEALVQSAATLDPKASIAMANQVSKRAEDLLFKVEDLRANNITSIVRNNLDAYEQEVKTFYSNVKEAPGEFTQDYRFDFEDMGIRPIVETIGDRIENPAIKQRFANILTRIEDAADGRTFNDLIDLRQAINDMKYNGAKLKYSDNLALDKTIKTIDTEIDKAAKTHIPQYDTWAKSWERAKTEYAKMKDTQESVFYKALTKEGISEDTVITAMTKYIGAQDDTFYRVMEKLPKNVQNRVEGTVFNNLVNKFADGLEGSRRAIHFPQLSKELSKVAWQSPQVKQLARTVDRMAEVFKNDIHLASVSGKIQLPKFQSYLTTDPVVRAKYELASTVFNYVKQFKPGSEGDNLALVKRVGKLLENPLDAKSLDEMMRARPKDRRNFRQRLDFGDNLDRMRQAYIERQMALRQLFGKDAPPRLVWKSNPADLAKITNPEPTILRSSDEILYGTARGTVGANASQVSLDERASDLITEFIWQNSNKANSEIVEQATKYMDEKRYTSIMQNVANKLKKDETEANARLVANSIKAEAGILIKRIEKDFGLKLPKDEAEKIVAIKFKEIMEACNGK